MKSICIYCGSSRGRLAAYTEGAKALAESLVRRNLKLVYGGAHVGMMGVLADEVVRLGGHAIGVIPESLAEKEVAHDRLTELHITQSMHERKTLMAELADAFIALPGGLGTLEEVFEIWTWAQLGFHHKPVGLLNIAGFFNSLVHSLDHAVQEEFINPVHRSMLVLESEADLLLDRFESYVAPTGDKWDLSL